MKWRTVLGEFLPVIGTIGLLGLWTYQVTELGKSSAELQRLDAAFAAYQTYQSNNALFNALVNTTGKKDTDQVVEGIRELQARNYELGLDAIEKVLPTELLKDVPAADPLLTDTTKLIANIQTRLEKLQILLGERQQAIRVNVAHANKWYVAWYIILSSVAIVGALFKALDKISSTSS
jgi:hypothetical protein